MIIGFFHIAKIGGAWDSAYKSVWHDIVKFGLLDATDKIFVNVVGTDNLTAEPIIDEIIKNPKVIVTEVERADVFEYSTFIRMQEELAKIPENVKVWYVHGKGATTVNWGPPLHAGPKNGVAYWHEYMKYFILERWQDCVSALDSFDVAGVEWRELPGKHFSGNFWWANSNYLKKLPDAKWFYEQAPGDRIRAEMYMGQANPTHLCFHNFNAVLYLFCATPELYRRRS